MTLRFEKDYKDELRSLARKYYKRGKPSKVLGLIDIRDQDYALVQWEDVGKAYVPLKFIQRYYSHLLVNFFIENAEWRLTDTEG